MHVRAAAIDEPPDMIRVLGGISRTLSGVIPPDELLAQRGDERRAAPWVA